MFVARLPKATSNENGCAYGYVEQNHQPKDDTETPLD